MTTLHDASRMLLAIIAMSVAPALPGASAEGERPGTLTLQDFEAVSASFDPVPVFYLVNSDGAAVAIGMPGGGVATPIFFDPETADRFRREDLERLPDDDALPPRIEVMSLGQLYRYQIEHGGGSDPGSLKFAMVAADQHVQAAREILGDDSFNAVPVFAARRASSGEFLTIQREQRLVMPMFLEADVLKSTIDQLAKSDPELAADLAIEVLSLDAVVGDLASGALPGDRVSFVIPHASAGYLRGGPGR